ncbi:MULTISPECIES: M23 family metallopeptidase [Bacillaceae]|uniref:Stage IV sporulation protein FA n=1 Tax=Peribacillus huizhouensis TaxID=1501239 RepID=A0ABR6CL00_9BACI|nr:MULTISPECIES: M23 family metallopeptidase [Bacillaceae]MBA9025724.1 stage IV sporulation protein FA [Peribacillus huizhouensis]
MDDRRKRIQERIAKRRKRAEHHQQGAWANLIQDETDGYSPPLSYESPSPGNDFPLFKKEWFLFKILAAACLFLLVAIAFKHPSTQLDEVRSVVKETMNQEFQFATVASWYEDTFGKPIAFYPDKTKKESGTVADRPDNQSALPVIGKITESFEVNGEGVLIETSQNKKVNALREGIVMFAGVKEGLGKTVMIQHADKSESWYGQLESVDVKLYDPVAKGTEIGKVTASENGSKGTFYLAIKKNDQFIDPTQVISFE